MKIHNKYLDEFDFDAARELMDDDICEKISQFNLEPQYFYDLYVVKHKRKFGEEFAFDRKNPQV